MRKMENGVVVSGAKGEATAGSGAKVDDVEGEVVLEVSMELLVGGRAQEKDRERKRGCCVVL